MGENEAELQNDQVLSFMGKFLNAMKTAAGKGAESLLVDEYIMDKFTYMTLKTERGHYLQKGEVEYILCGNGNQLANISNIEKRPFSSRL